MSTTITDATLTKWQSVLSLVSDALELPAALIMRLAGNDLQVFARSENERNPYPLRHQFELEDSGVYCEDVIRRNAALVVEDALHEARWKDGPDAAMGMTAYCGLPLHWPNGETFGTLCAIDDRSRPFTEQHLSLMARMRELVESHLALLEQADMWKQLYFGLDATSRSLSAHFDQVKRAMKAGGVGVWEMDPITYHAEWDDRMHDLHSLQKADFDGSYEMWCSLIHPEDFPRVNAAWLRAVDKGSDFESQYRIVWKDGTVRHLHTVVHIERRAGGPVERIGGMNWDVTDEVMSTQQMEARMEHFHTTLEAIGDAVIATDLEAKITYMNPSAEKLTGWDEAEAAGRVLSEVFVTRDELTGELRANAVKRCFEVGSPLLLEDGVLHGRHGGQFNIQKRVSLIRREDGELTGAVVTFQDITQARLLQKELKHSATHDALTGLANRTAFQQRLNEVWQSARENDETHALCLLDLDRFKIINDTSGHAAGDALLREVSRMLQAGSGKNDFVARMGGDEFLLLLLHCNAAQAEQRAQAVLKSLSCVRFPWNGKLYDVGVSIGLVPITRESISPQVIVSQADVACYAAKHNGRNCVSVYSVDGGDADTHHQQLRVVAGLRRAIEEDRFVLYAQPICPADPENSNSYYELLLRMRDEDGSLVSPALFIPAAERYGLMSLIDRWVITTALHRYGPMMKQHSDVHFSINLSARTLSEDTLWDYIQAELEQSGIEAGRITLEVTETALIQNMTQATKFLHEARAAGVCVALDDFGTGLSSLSYLKQFPLDVLKIDGAFIKGLAGDKLDQTIVRAITEVAHSMGANTVAECVEDDATLTMARSLGVDMVQGWGVGQVVPLDDVFARLTGKVIEQKSLQPKVPVLQWPQYSAAVAM